MKNQKRKGFHQYTYVIFFLLTFFSILSHAKTTTQANGEQAQNSGALVDQGSTDNRFQDILPEKEIVENDPLEHFNRGMFAFNDKFDTYLYKPVATYYNIFMPPPVNNGIHNFFNNLGQIPTIINDFLQFHFRQMMSDFWRLFFNTTLGFGGFFDVATGMDLPYYENDFGLTLAYWGYHNSSYLVLPFLGSYTIRDGIIGMPVDYFAFSVYPRIKPDSVRFGVLGLYFIDYRAQLLRFQPVFEAVALDKYVFVRSAYLQRRASKIEENRNLQRSPSVNPEANSAKDEAEVSHYF